jgi:hypothetical protein
VEPPPEAKSDSIPSAIGSANIFAPADVQAQETQAEPLPGATSPSPEVVPPAAGTSLPLSSPSGASIATSPVPSEPLPKASSQSMPVGAAGTTNGKITSSLPTSTTHSSTNQGHTTQSAKANETPGKPSLEGRFIALLRPRPITDCQNPRKERPRHRCPNPVTTRARTRRKIRTTQYPTPHLCRGLSLLLVLPLFRLQSSPTMATSRNKPGTA